MLVGGFGTRLRPLTLDVKKELMPVANRPFLEHVLAHLAKHGVEEAILTTGYLAEAFEAYPADQAHGVKLTIVKEDEPLDSCGAVKNVEDLIDGTFLVCNGDILTSLDITALVSYHRERETLGTLALKAVDDPSAYGLVPIDDDGRIERFVEKPKPGDEIWTNLINAGTYVLEPSVLADVPVGTMWSFERQVFPSLVERGAPVFGFASEAYWLDIGTPERYLQAHWDVLEGRSAASALGRRVGDVLLADGAKAPSLAGPAVLGPGAVAAEGATLERAVLLAGARVEAGATVRDSVIGPNAIVGSGATCADALVAAGDRVTT